MLQQAGFGLGSVALAGLIQEWGLAGESSPSGNSLAPKKPHFAPKAKRIIHLFMNGGPSQIDTFDPKPALAKHHGKVLGGEKAGSDKRVGGVAYQSPFKFAKHGQSGIEISELFPHLAKQADELCIIRSMYTDVPNHEPGLMMMNCGEISQPRPCLGSWLLYGLGTENQSLPGFVAMCPSGLPTAASSNWRNAFLPGIYQGTYVDSQEANPDRLIANLRNDALLPGPQRRQLSYIQQLNELHLAARSEDDDQLEARIQAFELAFRMQSEALDAFDYRKEPQNIRELYGETLHGHQCLMARRLVERGVRFVQVYHGAGQPWDSHNDLEGAHRRLALQSDQAVAALLADLKQRDMLKDTLVIWGGEMGRTPTVQLPVTPKVGRDHHHDGFTVWMAGGGSKGGHVHGQTDELGLHIAEDKVHVHDLHATILHLMGFDHERLTYHYSGRDFRLTDVHGTVVRELLA
jgi:hypothetical protein